MAIGTTSTVKSRNIFGADVALIGSNLSLGSKSAQTCIGGRFQLGLWAVVIAV